MLLGFFGGALGGLFLIPIKKAIAVTSAVRTMNSIFLIIFILLSYLGYKELSWEEFESFVIFVGTSFLCASSGFSLVMEKVEA